VIFKIYALVAQLDRATAFESNYVLLFKA